MLNYAQVRWESYYAQIYASIMSQGLTVTYVASCCVHVLCNYVQLHMHILVVTLVYSLHCTVASCSTVVQDLCNTITLH